MRQLGAAAALPLAILFIANIFPSLAQTEVSAAAGVAAAGAGGAGGAEPAGDDVIVYDIKHNLTLRCPLQADAAKYQWSKNGTDVEQEPKLKERFTFEEGGAVFRIARTNEDDYGNYSCRAGADEAVLRVRGRSYARLPPNANVVEGQKLKLTCRLVGRPYPGVQWSFSNDTFNASDVRAALGADRVTLRPSEQGAADAELVLEAAQRSDAGVFSCAPLGAAPGVGAASSTLRVKDMYAALWPFLGIVAEVAALCAVILVYERRRGKPEPEDSDADHDAKKS